MAYILSYFAKQEVKGRSIAGYSDTAPLWPSSHFFFCNKLWGLCKMSLKIAIFTKTDDESLF